MSAPTTTKPVALTCDDDYDPYVAPRIPMGLHASVHVDKDTTISVGNVITDKGRLVIKFSSGGAGPSVDVFIDYAQFVELTTQAIQAITAKA